MLISANDLANSIINYTVSKVTQQIAEWETVEEDVIHPPLSTAQYCVWQQALTCNMDEHVEFH